MLDFKDMAERKSTLKIRVTDEQRELIAAMWNHNDWELEIVDEDNNEPDNLEAPLLIAPDPRELECPYCFSSPCVTDQRFRQAWWDEPHQPHRNNNVHRKPLYRRFWVMLANRGAWRDPRYLQKKTMALNEPLEAQNNMPWAGPASHPRDIMPDCVLKTVRHWRPNLPGQPYMGHKWI
jgi:hypothetical protein